MKITITAEEAKRVVADYITAETGLLADPKQVTVIIDTNYDYPPSFEGFEAEVKETK